MKLIPIFSITAAMFILSACATGPRKVSLAEATAFENQAITDTRIQPTSSPQPGMLYTQPVNKTEPCMLLTDQPNGRNSRVYWDGDCIDGHAYGLGRVIALSDTYHTEEITIHNGDGYSNWRPVRVLDYIENHGMYGKIKKDAAHYLFSGLAESITSDSTNFFMQYRLGAMNSKGNRQYLDTSPFNPAKVIVNHPSERVEYVLVDFSALPATSYQVQKYLFLADPTKDRPAGFRIALFRNGIVEHQKLTANGQRVAELVQLPPEYIDQLKDKIFEAQVAIQKASEDVAKAQRMEREYLYMACADDYSIKGVPAKDMNIARQICTWRDQWTEPYARAEAKYKQEMEQKQQEAARAEQQNAYIAAQKAQAAAAQNAAFAASMAELNQTLQQQNNNTMQQINQMNQQMQQQNNQKVNSWAPQMKKTTICNRIGNQVFCRQPNN
ncbi:Hypothetical protein HDN1F_29700 [gamma proteobacterium HdN1]|nr:Hypothetical protein HDN1F_29700 [gamma proteobacterium HdN1]